MWRSCLGTPFAQLTSSLHANMGEPEIENVLIEAQFPDKWPFSDSDFNRYDESTDSYFYEQPRIGVFHIDDRAVRAITKYYAKTLPTNARILDMCSSWVSHLPEKYEAGKLTVMGMNQAELDANPRADEKVVQDLNRHVSLPFEDNSFDIITNVVSVDYLTKPLQVFKEMGRVLKPGGRAIMSFSNRCFPTKAIDIWGRSSDAEHVYIVGCYFHYSGMFEAAIAKDLHPGWFGLSDPMYVVEAKAL